MALNSLEGITLRSFPLKEHSKIVKVYTDKRGLLSFVANRVGKKNAEITAFCSPCTYSEIVYVDKNKELFNLKEVSLKNLHLSLRDSFEKIEAATSITNSILLSQLQDKPNDILFKMITKYLHKLSHSINPYAYLCSFQLKLLLLEGMLHLSKKCSICNSHATYIVKGDYFCDSHMRHQGIAFNASELKTLILLAKAEKFSEIDTIKVPNNLKQKIQKLFLHILD